MAGGVHVGGDKSDIRIVRGPIDATRVYATSLRDIVDGESHDVELYPGDVVYVTDHWIEDFSELTGMLAPLASIAFSVAAILIALDNRAQASANNNNNNAATNTDNTAQALKLAW